MLKPKVGDLVRLKPLKVANVSDSGCFSTVGTPSLFQWNEFNIEEVLPRPLAVGDRVVRIDTGNPIAGTVKAIDEPLGGVREAWVRFDCGYRNVTVYDSSLRRIDEPATDVS